MTEVRATDSRAVASLAVWEATMVDQRPVHGFTAVDQQDDPADWVRTLDLLRPRVFDEAVASGHFLYAVTFFLTSGRKPT